MRFTTKFVIRSTLALLGIGFIALWCIVLASIWLSERAQTNLQEVSSAREMHNSATLVREGLLTAETSQRGFVLTGNEIYLAPYDNAKTMVLSEFRHLSRQLAPRPDRSELIRRLSAVITAKFAEQDRSIFLRGDGRDAEALALVTSNRGKTLMDEANVYLSAITLEGDERLANAASQQSANAQSLRLTSIASALVIMLVIAGVVITLYRYTREIILTREATNRLNETLESRVQQRTTELTRARDRAEVLLTEVNHRVSNSLALVTSLIGIQARGLNEPAAKAALEEANTRIMVIAQMHRHLFSTGSVGEVAADAYLDAVLSQFESAMTATGSATKLTRDLAPVTLPTSDAVNVGIVVTEWVTNAVKYAYPDGYGEVRVRLEERDGIISIVVEDDGIGRGPDSHVTGSGYGTRVVNTIANLMRSEIHYSQRDPGTEARLSIPVRTTGTPVTGRI